MESEFSYAARTTEIAIGKTKKITIGEAEILIVNVESKFYAIDSLCTHYGGDLSEGTLQGRILTCPVHGAKFDVTDGKVVSPPVEPLDRPEIENLNTYPLRIENGEISIKIS
ncbi:MAG TPA: Rieske 2Fe-2S domain-containing protein [Candidatus Acidoferrales bacterium]|nr:Rieske 2Fe-2S domain-containing protein [Candidatus Acidoferrales bacterium]